MLYYWSVILAKAKFRDFLFPILSVYATIESVRDESCYTNKPEKFLFPRTVLWYDSEDIWPKIYKLCCIRVKHDLWNNKR